MATSRGTTQKIRRVRTTRKRTTFSNPLLYPGPEQCHPRVGDTRPASGCLPLEILKEAADQLGVPTSLDPEQLLEATAEKVGVSVKHQRTFLNALPFSQERKDELAKQWLRPAHPASWIKDPDMWLDSNNIKDVMKQYEEAFSTFKFLGPFPIDFAAADPYDINKKKQPKCLISQMCSLDLGK
jgi:hypothetical protein